MNEKEIRNYVNTMRSELIERLEKLSKLALSQNENKDWTYAFDNQEEIIDCVDDLIKHSKILGVLSK